jgi:hypothetical protein
MYRLPTSNSDVGGTPWKQNVNGANGAGTVGQVNDPRNVPPFPSVNDGSGSTAGANGAPPGAPQLPAPRKEYSPSEMAIEVSALISRIDDAQSDVEQNGLQMDGTQKQEAFQKSNESIATAAKKLAAAKHKQKILGPLATIGKVFLSIAAVALAVVTGGAASPLAVAMIAYTVVDTTLTVADAISKAAGGPALGLGDLLQEGFTKLAKACGASDKEAETIGKWTAFAVQGAIAVLTVAYSISNVVSMVRGTLAAGGSVASKLGTTALKATKMAGVGSQFVGGATNVTAGGLTVAVGVETGDAAKAQAAKAQFDAVAAALGEAMQNTLDRLKQIAEDLSSGMQTAAKDISDISQTNVDIAGGNVSMV